MSELDFTAFSGNLKSCCDKVADEKESIVVTLEGERKVILVNYEEIIAMVAYFESLTFFNMAI